jgi:hypothetical protein
MLRKLGDEFSERGWEIGRKTDKAGIDRNREKGVGFIPLTPEMAAATKEVLTKVVLPSWLKRSGPDARMVFDQYLAPHSGITLP